MKNPKKIKCPRCKGKGELTICGTCKDTGTVIKEQYNEGVWCGNIFRKCPDCDGPVISNKESK